MQDPDNFEVPTFVSAPSQSKLDHYGALIDILHRNHRLSSVCST